MKSKVFAGFYFLASLIIFSARAEADVQPYRASVSTKVSAISEVFNQNKIHSLKSNGDLETLSEPLTFTLRIPGQGRVKYTLNKVRTRDWSASAYGRRQSSKLILLQGKLQAARLGSDKLPAAASIYLKNAKPWLQLNFKVQRSRSRKSVSFYEVKVPLESLAQGLAAEVSRVPSYVLETKSCGSEATHLGDFAGLKGKAAALQGADTRPAVALPATVKIIDLRTRADSQWATVYGSGANDQIATTVNAADAIYRGELGIGLNIVGQVISDTGLSATESGTLLEQFVSDTTPSQYATADEHHLFTGRNLDGSTIGIAYLGVVCGPRVVSGSNIFGSFGLSQNTAAALNFITFAHELGHNLDASHDWSPDCTAAGYFEEAAGGANPLCDASVGNTIMYPSVGSSQTSFSAGTRSQVGNYVNSFGSCMASSDAVPTATPVPGATATATSTATPVGGGGGGGGIIPGTPVPTPPVPSMTLDTTLAKTGKLDVTMTATGTADASCDFWLSFSADSKFKVAKTVKIGAGDSTSISFIANVNRRATVARGRSPFVYLRSEYTCDGTRAFGKSKSKKLNPTTIKSRSPGVSLSDWIKLAKSRVSKSLR